MISQIAEAISAFFYSMDVMVLCTQILIDLMERFIGRVNDYLLYSAYYR